MDHLPPVADPYQPIEVPYLGGVYDFKGFSNFHVRSNHDLLAWQQGDISTLAPSFLQSWFFFGLLDDVLQLPPEQRPGSDEFVRDGEDGRQIITTRKLREYLHLWKIQIDLAKQDDTGDRLRIRNERAVQTLNEAFQIWQGFDDFPSAVGPEVELSIQILATTLEHALNCVSEVAVEELPWRTKGNAFLESTMIRDGWCPSMIHQLRYPTQLAFLYYAHLLGPPTVSQHPDCEAGGRGCKQKQIDNNTCRPAHVERGCNCEMISPDLKELDRIVALGKIPVLSFDGIAPEPMLKVEAHDPREMQYTAFSHM